MPWGRVDDTWYDHPKLDALAGSAEWPDRLAAAGLCSLAWSWCNRFLTDGHVPANRVVKLGATIALADQLVAVGLWHEAPGGYQINDFLDYNESRAQTVERREKEAKRKADWRAGKRSPDGTSSVEGADVPPSVPLGVPPGRTPDVRRDTRARTRSANPDPTRPDPTESISLTPTLPASGTGGRRSDGTNPRSRGTNPRAAGTNPRATATNPRATATNPRAQRNGRSHQSTTDYDALMQTDDDIDWLPDPTAKPEPGS